ncbi:MAG: PilZ domain-containing protein [Candidatus Omnitrophota bacterium]|nr:PilZ domain-containing protein [Candidatus Omnitrophota bacterium]
MKDRRIFERLKAKITLRFSTPENKEDEGESVDISGNGISFLTKEGSLKPNMLLEISLIVHGSSEKIHFKNKIAWIEKVEKKGYQRIGVHLEKERLMKIAYVLQKKKEHQ